MFFLPPNRQHAASVFNAFDVNTNFRVLVPMHGQRALDHQRQGVQLVISLVRRTIGVGCPLHGSSHTILCAGAFLAPIGIPLSEIVNVEKWMGRTVVNSTDRNTLYWLVSCSKYKTMSLLNNLLD